MLNQRQPRGFSIFFLTEMWERYGFYVLQSLLVFYATQKLNLNDSATYAMVGSFTALAYINSIFGGIIADKYFGYDKAILAGAATLCIGYLLLTIATSVDLFVLGLATVTMGTGLLKPNISSMLSLLYKENPEKKEMGYTLFYVGIYFGAIGGSFLGGFIRTYLGWHAVFASAAIGLAIAFITFKIGKVKFKLHDTRGITHTSGDNIKAIGAILVLIAIAFVGIYNDSIAEWLFVIIAILSAGFILNNIKIYNGTERRKLIAFAILVLFSILYWAVYFQQFFSVSLCTARVTNLTLPESSLTAFESLGVILFGPLVNVFWLFLQKRNKDFSIPAKFSLSFLFNGISFLILVFGLHFAASHGVKLNQIFIIVSYLIIALGELFISPIGLAMVSTLVPQRLNGAMMGIFLMSIGFGGKLAGYLAQSSVNNDTNVSLTTLEAVYRSSFETYAFFSLGIFILCILAIKPINKLILGTKRD